jgi:hypothetical protein
MLDLLGMKESDYNRYWSTQVYRGEAQSGAGSIAVNRHDHGGDEDLMSIYLNYFRFSGRPYRKELSTLPLHSSPS